VKAAFVIYARSRGSTKEAIEIFRDYAFDEQCGKPSHFGSVEAHFQRASYRGFPAAGRQNSRLEPQSS
jgi:hypothetical protein